MGEKIYVRKAQLSDAESCCTVLCASIRELCVADHQNNKKIVDSWTSNKTPDNLRRWIQDPHSTIYVAEISGSIAGVGGLNDLTNITLNYVSPDFRFTGVSKAMLATLESTVYNARTGIAKLTSTQTAHNFYKTAGWRDVSEPEVWLGMKGYPMEKKLSLGIAKPSS